MGEWECTRRLRYDPWGETRYTYATTPTGYRYTGQREDNLLKLYDYNARYYDANIGRFLSADTLVPDPTNPQAFNRFSYTRNNPVNRIDPTGHQDAPSELPVLVQQAINFFTGLGWEIIGDPAKINPNWNGADLVFKTKDGTRILAAELKDVAGNVNLGTLVSLYSL